MTSLATELKQVLARRIDIAPTSELLSIATALCAEPEPVVAPRSLQSQWQIFNDDIAFDPVTSLYMTRTYVPGGQRNWSDSMQAASKLDLNGWKWRAPTIQEQLTVIDYQRCDPAINTDVFNCKSDWVWTSTQAKRPSDYAWFVYFGNGNSSRFFQNGYGYVLAVRASQ